jgi:4-hydroxymandelate synthase
MAVLRIGHIEICAADRAAAVDYFASSFGLSILAHAISETGHSTLLAAGDVQLVVTAGPEATGFLERHGDGVADITFVCDDPETVRAQALAAGGRPVGPGSAVSAFGSVRHTLLPPSASGWPGGRAWVPATAAEAADRRGGHLEALDHIAVCVEADHLDDCVAYYRAGFGFERYSSEFIEVGSQAMDSVVVRNRAATATFTLLQPVTAREAGQIDAFLDRNCGAGVQHLAFLVNEIVPAVREYRERGVEFLTTPGAYYDALTERLREVTPEINDLRETGVLVDRDEWGHLMQLFTRSPHERNTLFYELIQRRGARGFGSANIRALYEAVERDRLVAE